MYNFNKYTWSDISHALLVFALGCVLGFFYTVNDNIHVYKVTVIYPLVPPPFPSDPTSPFKKNNPKKEIPVDNVSFPTEEECLAKNIYFEAGNQSIAGKEAVGAVVLNRVKDERYPDSICDVVFERYQFSWFWDGKPDTPNYTDEQWEISQNIAKQLILRNSLDLLTTFGATHYHADYVSPRWSKTMKRVAKIDQHVFYE